MGGALRPVPHRGELRVVEHNVGRDPDAARVLLRDAEPLLVVPLDVSATMLCSREEELAMIDAQPRLADMIARWRVFAGDVPLCLSDPLALFALFAEPDIEVQDYPVSVNASGVMRSGGTDHDIVVAADRDAVVARVLDLLRAVP
jgi:inosine-uridine nucleoside N-ribohydrolase